LIKIQVPISKGIESLFGTHDENIRSFESALSVHTHLLEDSMQIEGEPESVRQAEGLLSEYESLLEEGHRFSNGDVKDFLGVVKQAPDISLRRLLETSRKRTFGRKSLSPRSPNQMLYFEAIDRCDMVFGIGYSDDIGRAKAVLARVLEEDARVLDEPAPTIGVVELADSSGNFVVRPWVKRDDYWGVYFDTHERVKLAMNWRRFIEASLQPDGRT